MCIDRRTFVELTVGGLASAVLPGCASVAVTRVVPSGGTVRLPILAYPQLAHPGGYLKIQPGSTASPIYVLALRDGGYAAVSPICTHRGCTVNIEGAHLVCPCHGSTFDRAGQVLRGPAERPLRRFPTALTSDGGELVIQLESES
jgi:Rieske Fe-S protein